MIKNILWSMLFVLIIASCDACTGKSSSLKCNAPPKNYKTIIVDKHNQLRQLAVSGKQKAANGKILPKAVSMPNMAWNQSLADAAQAHANDCQFVHNQPKVAGFNYVGQNLNIFISTQNNRLEANYTGAIQSWYNEVQYFVVSTLSKYDPVKSSSDPNEQVGHFTQVIWAKTKYVGCGFSCFKNPTSGYPYQQLIVCNYGEGGNYDGEPVYVAKK